MPDQDLDIARVALLTAAEPADDALVGTALLLDQVCRAAARDLPATGVALGVLDLGGGWMITAASDGASRVAEGLHAVVGEGPSLEACSSRAPVAVENLNADDDARWPVYIRSAADLGIRSVFAFPLLAGTSCLGALGIQRDRPGAMSEGAVRASASFAAYAAAALVDGQAQAGTERLPSGVAASLASQFEVHQAQGMLTVQLGVELEEALVRLKAHAFAHGRTPESVARDVVARVLLLERDHPDRGAGSEVAR